MAEELPKAGEVAPAPATPEEGLVPTEATLPAEASKSPVPPEPSEAEPRAEAPPRTRRPVGLFVAVALIAGVAIAWMASDSEPEAEVEAEAAAGAGAGTVPADHANEPHRGEGLRPDTQREGSPPTASAPHAGAGTETGTGASDPAADLAPLAVLPVTPPEILSQNTWARRNRAAEIRAEARALYGTRHWEEARETLLLSLQWDPSNIDAQRNVSRTFQQMHEMEQALSWSRRAVATDGSDPRSHELLGDQLLMMGHEVEALAAYRAGLEAAPRDARLRVRVRRLEEVPEAAVP
jgi:tetratricopeptide (TPR) repeat protein